MRNHLVAALLGLGLAASAQASVITYEFDARITLLFGSGGFGSSQGIQPGTQVRMGDALVGRISYDTEIPLVDVDGRVANYQSPLYSSWFSYTILPIAQTFVSDPHAGINVSDDLDEGFGLIGDLFAIANPDGQDAIVLRGSNDILNSLALPIGNKLSQFDGQLLSGWRTADGDSTFMLASLFNLRQIGAPSVPDEEEEVPEPASAWLMLSALGLGVLARRRTQARA